MQDVHTDTLYVASVSLLSNFASLSGRIRKKRDFTFWICNEYAVIIAHLRSIYNCELLTFYREFLPSLSITEYDMRLESDSQAFTS